MTFYTSNLLFTQMLFKKTIYINDTKKTKDVGGLGEPETKGGRVFRLTC